MYREKRPREKKFFPSLSGILIAMYSMVAEVLDELSGRRFDHVISFGSFDATGQGCVTRESVLYRIPGFGGCLGFFLG
jgi:hypothetical protein